MLMEHEAFSLYNSDCLFPLEHFGAALPVMLLRVSTYADLATFHFLYSLLWLKYRTGA